MPSVNAKPKDLQKAWQETYDNYQESLKIVSIIDDIGCGDLYKRKQFTQRNGSLKTFYQPPTRSEIEGDFQVRINELTISADEFFEDYLDLEYQPYDYYTPEGHPHHYFWGESCYGFGGNQDEDDPSIMYFPYYFAYGGPTIYLQYTVRLHLDHHPDRKPYVNILDLIKAEYIEAWWGQGGSIDITKCQMALEIFENEFEERIMTEIDCYIQNNPDFKIPKEKDA